MNWDQIENNWVAMTRRVRPERPYMDTSGIVSMKPSDAMSEVAESTPDRPLAQSLSDARRIG